MKDLPKNRLLELLADQTIFGLSAEESVELETLKKQFPEWENDFTLELTAAAIGLFDLDVSEDLPDNLRTRVFARADEFFAPQEDPKKVVNFAPPVEKTTNASTVESVGGSVAADETRRRPFWHWLGWGLAAATCIAIALGLWLGRSRNEPEIVGNPETVRTPEVLRTPESVKTPEIISTPEVAQTTPEPVKTPEAVQNPQAVKTPETVATPETARTPRTARTPEIAGTPEVVRSPTTVRTPVPVRTPAPELTTVQKREQLIASAPDLVRTNWSSPKGVQRFSGDVVWSNTQQSGYVRLRGMPVLEADETYQLWIVDDERDEKKPISAGLFTVNSAGEIIVPLNAELRVIKAKQFAISKEKAGGVTATKPDRIVAVAKI